MHTMTFRYLSSKLKDDHLDQDWNEMEFFFLADTKAQIVGL